MSVRRWYNFSGEEQNVAVSSRIRLARNLREYPFENRMTNEQKYAVIGVIDGQLTQSTLTDNQALERKMFDRLSEMERMALVEQRMISPAFAQEAKGRDLFVSQDHSISIMVNEEDHIRIQVLKTGIDLQEALSVANTIDDIFDKKIDYAFHEMLGFLTHCPTNLGTGLRASVMLHLPLLENSGYLKQIGENIVKLGLTLRGTYGEGTAALGSYYQISNQVTLGISEQAAIENLQAIVQQIIFQERNLRQNAKNTVMEDKIWRAYGLLTNARLLSFKEFMSLTSLIRLGIDYGFIKDVDYQTLNELTLYTGDAHICLQEKRDLSDEERQRIRARIVRNRLLT